MITGNESANFVLACIVAILLGGLFIFIISIRQYLFTTRRDLYPVKYYKNGKAKNKTAGRKTAEYDMANQGGDNRPDGPHYDQIVNDYPTYERQGGLK